MHIAINTSPMSGGHSGRGIGLYTKELINALAEFEKSHTYSYFRTISEVDERADIIHYPFFDPFFLTLPHRSFKPTVVTCHDLIPIVFAKHFPRGIRGELKWQIQKRRLTQIAQSIITDSTASKMDIERVLAVSTDRVFTVPLAPRSVFRPINDDKRLSKAIKQYKLNNKYILYVGDVNWNKNIPGIITAFDLYAKKRNTSLQLILVGKAFTDPTLAEVQAIRMHIGRLGLADAVKMPGFITDEDLASLYAGAQMLLCPSFAEGFGFPVLEAQSCGCPVVTSNISSLMEIAGPAVCVNPYKPEDIRRGIDVILSLSSKKRRDMIKKGFDWVKHFTWKKTAHNSVKVYEETYRHYSGI